MHRKLYVDSNTCYTWRLSPKNNPNYAPDENRRFYKHFSNEKTLFAEVPVWRTTLYAFNDVMLVKTFFSFSETPIFEIRQRYTSDATKRYEVERVVEIFTNEPGRPSPARCSWPKRVSRAVLRIIASISGLDAIHPTTAPPVGHSGNCRVKTQ